MFWQLTWSLSQCQNSNEVVTLKLEIKVMIHFYKVLFQGKDHCLVQYECHNRSSSMTGEPEQVFGVIKRTSFITLYFSMEDYDWLGGCLLTYWGRNKKAEIFQTTFSNAFSWMKMFQLWLKFHWSVFLRVQSIIFHHRFRKWFGAVQATSHYLIQWWSVYRCIYVSLPQFVNKYYPLAVYHLTKAVQKWYHFDTDPIRNTCYSNLNEVPSDLVTLYMDKVVVYYVYCQWDLIWLAKFSLSIAIGLRQVYLGLRQVYLGLRQVYLGLRQIYLGLRQVLFNTQLHIGKILHQEFNTKQHEHILNKFEPDIVKKCKNPCWETYTKVKADHLHRGHPEYEWCKSNSKEVGQ